MGGLFLLVLSCSVFVRFLRKRFGCGAEEDWSGRVSNRGKIVFEGVGIREVWKAEFWGFSRRENCLNCGKICHNMKIYRGRDWYGQRFCQIRPLPQGVFSVGGARFFMILQRFWASIRLQYIWIYMATLAFDLLLPAEELCLVGINRYVFRI